MSFLGTLGGIYQGAARGLSVLEPLSLLGVRLAAAQVFFFSGLNKWTGFSVSNNTYQLFLYEYFCPDPARPGALRLCGADDDYAEGTWTVWGIERLAELAAVAEIVLPVMLVLGFLGRFAALGLLGMTLFIEFFVFPDAATWWGSHVWWAACLFVAAACGPGLLSVDRVIGLEGPRVSDPR